MSTRGYYTERRRKRRMRRKLINRVILILAMVCILTVGIFVASFFSTRFEYETVISGIDCSFLTVEEATEKINAEIKDKTFLLTVLYKNETGDVSVKKYAVSSKKLNMELKTDLRELFYQEKETGKKDFEAQFEFDENELKNYLLTVSELQEENFVQPQNAYLELTEDGIVLEKEVYGLEIVDINSAYNFILRELRKGNLDIDITGFYETEPDILSTDETLIENQTKINQSLNTKITFMYSDNTEEVLDKSTIITWLYQDADGLFYFDEAKIVEYVDNLAEFSLEKTSQVYFNATDLGEITFSISQTLAPQIDKESELSFIKEAINTGGEYVSKFQYDKEFIDTTNTYVELDITRQKVWLYVDEKCILETDCVTGNISRGYYTPTGLYFLTYKTRGATLKGEGYASYVEYWMPFNGNIGFHDASWRSSFGGNIYLTNGSHGCVNLPVEAAKTLYEYINESMPIFVYAS